MTAHERTEALIQAEGDLSAAVSTIVRVLGPDRGAEVATALVAERLRRHAACRQMIASLAREPAL